MRNSWYGRVVKIVSGLTFVNHKTTNWGIGVYWFSGPTFRSLNLEVGHKTYSLMLTGGYGYREAYDKIHKRLTGQESWVD